jgi:hypothetical protein
MLPGATLPSGIRMPCRPPRSRERCDTAYGPGLSGAPFPPDFSGAVTEEMKQGSRLAIEPRGTSAVTRPGRHVPFAELFVVAPNAARATFSERRKQPEFLKHWCLHAQQSSSRTGR